MSLIANTAGVAPETTEPHELVPAGDVPALTRLHHRTRTRTVAWPAAGPGRYLAVGEGREARLFPLDEQITHIGRGVGAGFGIEDHTVSRQHAIAALRPGGCRIFDDRSLNGTFVNGRRVLESDLSDGDVVVVGRVVLRYYEIAITTRSRPGDPGHLTAA